MQTGEIGRAERSRFVDARPIDNAAGQVGKTLHGPIGSRHTAVDAQNPVGAVTLAPISIHSRQKVDGLKANAFECGLRQFARPGRARQAEQRATRVRAPIRRTEADEGRHQIHLLGRIGGCGKWAGVFRPLRLPSS